MVRLKLAALSLGALSTLAFTGCLLTTSFDGIVGGDAGSANDGGGGGNDGGVDAPTGADGSTLIDSGADASASCACPAGTTGSNGDCTITGALPNASCGSPLVMPSCATAIHFQLCPSDPAFKFVDSTSSNPCVFDGGTESLPSAFIKLGVSPSGFKVAVSGAGLLAHPAASCTQADSVNCFALPPSGGTISGPPSNEELVISKTTSTTCDPITVTVTPL